MLRSFLQKLKFLSNIALGKNERNLALILPSNPTWLLPNADDKLRTKALLSRSKVAVPKTLAVFESSRDFELLEKLLEGEEEFVIKPSQSAGGRGILIVNKDEKGFFIVKNGQAKVRASPALLWEHIEKIIEGCFCTERPRDRAFAEELLRPHPALRCLSPLGLPDIRIIVHFGTPVMAMLRCATRYSKGKANLHEGGIGLGIDLKDGKTTHGVWKDKPVCFHPDTGVPLSGKIIPDWEKIKTLAVAAATATSLNFVGVDITIDALRGPVVLEVNARPGLSIQIANRSGLRPLLGLTEDHEEESRR